MMPPISGYYYYYHYPFHFVYIYIYTPSSTYHHHSENGGIPQNSHQIVGNMTFWSITLLFPLHFQMHSYSWQYTGVIFPLHTHSKIPFCWFNQPRNLTMGPMGSVFVSSGNPSLGGSSDGSLRFTIMASFCPMDRGWSTVIPDENGWTTVPNQFRSVESVGWSKQNICRPDSPDFNARRIRGLRLLAAGDAS